MLNAPSPPHDRGTTVPPMFSPRFSPYRQQTLGSGPISCGGYTVGRLPLCNGYFKAENKAKAHAFRKIWKCNQLPLNTCAETRKKYQAKSPITAAPDPVTLTWKQWPPPVVPVPAGLKIPVKITPDMLDPCYNEYAYDSGYSRGEDEVMETAEFVPDEEITRGACLRGVFNTHESESFSVRPSTVVFLNPEVGQTYTAVVKVRNEGCFPRRMGVINPASNCFDIDWGASIGERTLLPPGLSNRIIIKLRPKFPANINDMLTVIIDDDGAIVVPIVARSATNPALEMEEWDVGCSTVGNARIASFEVINRGGPGRFWLLTEEEFVNEYIDLYGPRRASLDQDQGKALERCQQQYYADEAEGEYEEEYGGGDFKPASPRKSRQSHSQTKEQIMGDCAKRSIRDKLMRKLDHLICHPFRIFPACFRLQRNQMIQVQIRYRPKHPSYHMRKLALLCDSGEVRWIAVKGIGIDPVKFPLVEFKGEWRAPPIDLPADLSARISLDCGDLLGGERKSQCFTIYNNSCMPLYFFWCVRHSRTTHSNIPTDGMNDMLELRQTIERPSAWWDYQDKIRSEDKAAIDPIKVFPSQGILKGREELEICVTVQGPVREGFYSATLSFFAQQIGDQCEEVLIPLVQRFEQLSANEDPVTYESLISVLPPKRDLHPSMPGRLKSKVLNVKSATYIKAPWEINQSSWGSGGGDGSENRSSISSGRKERLSSNAFRFPPMPFFYVKCNENDPQDYALTRLEYPRKFLSSRRFRKLADWNDGDSNDGNNRNEEQVYREYFGKVCTIDGKPERVDSYVAFLNDSSGGDGGGSVGIVRSPLVDATEVTDEWLTTLAEDSEFDDDDPLELRYGPQYARRPKTSLSQDAAREKQLRQREELRIQGCKMAMEAEQKKQWLDSKSPLQPVQEVEIWAQVIPLQCKFEPAAITACGIFSTRTTRDVKFFNNCHHLVQLTLDPVVTDVGSIICWPYEAEVEPGASVDIQFKFQFRRQGVREGRVKGSLRLPDAYDDEVHCWLPYRIQAEGPEVVTLTPLLDFGLIYPGTEHAQTLVLKNNGQLRTRWTAKMPDATMEDEDSNKLSFPGTQIAQKKIIRAWPEWGTIEPGETVAVQIFLSSTCPRRLSTACEITIEENPQDQIYVAIMADVMFPKVILRDVRLILTEAFKGVPNYELHATLQNLTAFPTAFRWCDPIGDQGRFISLKAWPNEGILPPKGIQTCQFEFLASEGMVLSNAFVPCCIAGVKEPLIARLEGTVFSLCIKIIIPQTKLKKIRQEDIPWECHDDIWPFICGLPEEITGEGPQPPHVSYLGTSYGRYCKVPVVTPPPPPTATQTQTKLADEEEEIEEEEEDHESELKKKKHKKGKGKEHHRNKSNVTTASPSKIAHLAILKKSVKKLRKKKTKKELRHSDEEETEEEEVEKAKEEVEIETEAEIEFPEEEFEMEAEEEEMDDSSNTIYSEGRLIYFQTTKWGEVITAKFQIFNESSRFESKFKFQVLRNPVDTVEKEPEGTRFVVLDDAFFYAMKNVYAEKVSLLRGKKGCVYNVQPSEGVLAAGGNLEVTIEFLANTHGVYEDMLECTFEGLDEPYLIKLVGISVICNKCPTPPPVEEVPPESPVEVCVRKLNPLLY